MDCQLIPMPNAWHPTHLFGLRCGHVVWAYWPDAPEEILEGEVTCHRCDGQATYLLKWWRVP